MAESSESILVQEDGIYTLHGSMKVDGNLEVCTQLATRELKVIGDDFRPMMQTSGDTISFKKACSFKRAEFTNGRTIIGLETTYNSAYVGTETLQAGQRIVVGDSLLKITADTRRIIADTFRMTLARLDVDNLFAKRQLSESIESSKVKVTGELIGQNIYADTIKTNKLLLDSIGSRNLQTSETVTARDLIVGGSAKIENDLTIVGTGVGPNGAALTVNGGEIVANWGIVSHTGNNRFQTMEIMGDSHAHDICLHVDRDVDSLFEGDVTVQGSKLILDDSKLVTDNVIVTSLGEMKADEPASGVQITTAPDWETYRDGMVAVVEPSDGPSLDDAYDPMDAVNKAMQRNESNYNGAALALKTLISPLSYLMEQNNPNIPKRFNIKNGVYRIDSNGNALVRNLVAEKGTFSQLNAYRFNVNKLSVDKLITSAVASNVVQTDNLLKSDGIAEFDGSVNIKADVFVEDGSNVVVSQGAKMVFQNGAELNVKNGAKLTLGSDTTVQMSGTTELDLNKLVFVDSTNGRRYRISFRDAHECEGGGIVMDYARLPDEEPRSDERAVEETELDASELDRKLKSLGI